MATLHRCRGHECELLLFMPAPTSEELLGFDARVCSPSHLDSLLRVTPYRFLLRTDVRFVCSVDVLIWPSVFDEEEGLTLPDWIGPNFPLWANLREMENRLGGISAAMPLWKVAITEVVASGEDANQRRAGTCWPALKTTEPSSLQEGWVFLGYDVADRSLLSGLSNCGYTEKEWLQYSNSFGRKLNDYHLFESLEVAMDFKELSNPRVMEHAPLYVYGLWRIP